MKKPSLNKLSIVVPAFNEETNIKPFYERCSSVFEKTGFEVELIFVDDGSRDATFDLVNELSAKDQRVKVIRLARNFGSHAAILAGLRHATGDATAIISVDLQDPPELLIELLAKWEEGFHIVWAVREGRDDPFLKKLFANSFYYILRKTALPNYPRTGMDFGLFDRKVIEALSAIRESNQFIVGLILWLGFRQAFVPYQRQARFSGVSKWPFWKRVKSALDAIVSFSYFPIRAISFTGVFVACLSMLYGLYVIFNSLYFGQSAAGYPSLMVAVLFLGGMQLITLGILGEYIWRGADQVKGRPQYLIIEKTGFEERHSANLPEKKN